VGWEEGVVEGAEVEKRIEEEVTESEVSLATVMKNIVSTRILEGVLSACAARLLETNNGYK
jgi:hypothetical protein